MTLLSLQNQLDAVEHTLDQVAELLRIGDAPSLAETSTALQVLSVELIQSLISTELLQPLPEALRARCKAASSKMALLRETLARRASYTEQALRTVLPTPPDVTYLATGSTPFSPIAPQSGALDALSA